MILNLTPIIYPKSQLKLIISYPNTLESQTWKDRPRIKEFTKAYLNAKGVTNRLNTSKRTINNHSSRLEYRKSNGREEKFNFK